MVSDKALLVLSFLGCLVSLVYYIKLPFFNERPSKRLVIGVLSKLNNFEQRKAIRSTWRKLLPPDVQFNFILGDTFCPYHELWRLSEDDCHEWKIEVPNWLKDGESLSLLETEKTRSKRNNKLYEGFSFRVMRFPIVFEGLGILTSALSAFQNLANLTVEVRDRATEEVVNSVTFNTSDLAAGPSKLTASGFTFKLFNEKNLPTVEFDGVLSLRADGGRKVQLPSLKKCSAVYDHSLGSHGLVHVTGLLDTDTILPFSKYSCPLVSLRYRVLDLHSLRRHTGAKKTQNFVESQKTKEFRRLLDREEEDHSDLMFVPVLDSRFNNTQKLKLYSKHLVESVDFDHLLLTDDTTFLFPHNILSKLRTMSSPKLWWSDFEVFKKTDYEQESSAGRYTSATYPPLPRSPAMVLSQSLVKFLAHNLGYLKLFGSLRVSLGVWLSGVDTRRHQDEMWSAADCGDGAQLRDTVLACTNVSPAQMRTVWEKLKKTGQ